MKTGPTLQTGACGDVVATRNRFGQYLRKRPSRKKRRNKPRTADTDRAEGDWRAISALWNTLTEEQYRAWEIAARDERSRPRAGQSGRLPPRHYFFKVNNSRASLGQPLIADPPSACKCRPESSRPTPVSPTAATVWSSGWTFRESRATQSKSMRPPPQNRGRARCGDFRVLGSLPPQTQRRERHHPALHPKVWRARARQAGLHSHRGRSQRPPNQSAGNQLRLSRSDTSRTQPTEPARALAGPGRITGEQPKYNRNTTEMEPNNNRPPRHLRATSSLPPPTYDQRTTPQGGGLSHPVPTSLRVSEALSAITRAAFPFAISHRRLKLSHRGFSRRRFLKNPC